VPWTMFNDNVQMGFFDVYDQYLVNILYDPRVRPGMTKPEVDAILPDIFSTVRAWVAQVNAMLGEDSREDLKVAESHRRTPSMAASIYSEHGVRWRR
jgi:Protein of unknown function (DUF2927)